MEICALSIHLLTRKQWASPSCSRLFDQTKLSSEAERVAYNHRFVRPAMRTVHVDRCALEAIAVSDSRISLQKLTFSISGQRFNLYSGNNSIIKAYIFRSNFTLGVNYGNSSFHGLYNYTGTKDQQNILFSKALTLFSQSWVLNL